MLIKGAFHLSELVGIKKHLENTRLGRKMKASLKEIFMKSIFYILVLCLAVSCASKKSDEKEIEQEAAQTNVTTSQALGGTIHDAIANSKTLKDAQKEELTKILESNKQRSIELSEQSYKYRAVLIQELLNGKATDARIKILENDIKKIEDLRLKNTFDTVKKVSAIVSSHPDKHEFAEHLINMEGKGSTSGK